MQGQAFYLFGMRHNHAIQVQKKAIELLMAERHKKGLSHERLAERAGLSRAAVGHIENGIRNPSLLLCLKLADALEVNLSELIKSAERSVKT